MFIKNSQVVLCFTHSVHNIFVENLR